VARVPPPKGDPEAPLRGLIFDSWYDSFLGATMLVRVVDGRLEKRARVELLSDKSEWDVTLLGVPQLRVKPVDSVSTGEVAVVAPSIRDPKAVRIGDTLIDAARPAADPLPGFKPMQPMVWSGLYPADAGSYDALRAAIDKLQLNDSSFTAD